MSSYGMNPFLNMNLGPSIGSVGMGGSGFASPLDLPADDFLKSITTNPQSLDSFSSTYGLPNASGLASPANPPYTFASPDISNIPTAPAPNMGFNTNMFGLNPNAFNMSDFSDANLSKLGVSNSYFMLRDQVNTMVGGVLGGIGPFIQQVMRDPKNFMNPGNPSPDNGGNPGDSADMTPSQGKGGKAVIDWALAESRKKHGNKKGISNDDDREYIIKNYAKGRDLTRVNVDGEIQSLWCAAFVSTAFEKNGGSPWGHTASVASIRGWGEKKGKYKRKGQVTPKPGNVIIFGSGGSSHVGIVTKVENGKVYTIEGNSSRAVNERSYSLSHHWIHGYVDV